MKSHSSLLFLLLCLVFSSPIFFSCTPDEEELQEPVINKSLIVGKWVNNKDKNEHWEYQSMGTDGKGHGVYWDSSEMTYDDAAKGPGLFEYYFNSTGLMRVFWMQTTSSYSNPDAEAPFIIDELTSSSMTYHPSGTTRSYSFSRQ